MTSGCKYLLLLPAEEGMINYGPFNTLPIAVEAGERLELKWHKLEHTTPIGAPHYMIVQIKKERYLGSR